MLTLVPSDADDLISSVAEIEADCYSCELGDSSNLVGLKSPSKVLEHFQRFLDCLINIPLSLKTMLIYARYARNI